MKKLYKKCIIGTLIGIMFIGMVALQPSQKACAAWYNDATDFYSAYGQYNKMVYANGYFYFGGMSKEATSVSYARYRTVGYKLKISTATQTVTIPVPTSGGIINIISQESSGGYHYQLNNFTVQKLSNLISAKNYTAGVEFRTGGGTIIVDNYMTTINGGSIYPNGGMNPDGTLWGAVYDTYWGITHAIYPETWGNPESLRSYFDVSVTYKSDLMSLHTVNAYYQDAQGNYGAPVTVLWKYYLYGDTVYWNSPADACYKQATVCYTATSNYTAYVYVPRNAYTQRTYIAYQDENGTYGNWVLTDTKAPLYGANYSYNFTGDALNDPISVNYTVTGDKDNYIKIPRKQFSVNLDKDEGINTVTGGGKHYIGEKVTINATLNDGYKWKGWEGYDGPFAQSYTFTMPANSISYKATSQPCVYTVMFDGNGATEGYMAPIQVSYKDLTKLPKNAYLNKLVPCKFVGWHTNKDSLTPLYTDEQTVNFADVITSLNSKNSDGTITLFAVWDLVPGFIVAKSDDRFFTLDEAQRGVITEKELLSTVKAFDRETNPILAKTKEEIVSSGNDIGITTMGFEPADFTTLKGKAVISQLYKVKDNVGNVAFLNVNVHVVDNKPVTVTRKYRSIEGKYLYKGYEANLNAPLGERKRAEDLELLEPEKGGLKATSYWRTHRSTFDRAFNVELGFEKPVRKVRVEKETLARLKSDLLLNRVDYIDIDRGADFSFSKPVGKDYEVLEYIRK